MYNFKSLLSYGAGTGSNVQVLKKSQFISFLLSTKGVLIDVRTPREFIEDHIENARNINFYDSGFITKIKKLDKDQPVFIYCRSGARSARAAKRMVKEGFLKIYDLKGGFLAWQK